MSETRPAIPRSIEREVRQRCGFGCVICGHPICDYDHIEEYSKVLEHTADNITLLCQNHHREKGNKLIPIDDLIKYNANPYCIENGYSSPYGIAFSGNEIKVKFGNIIFTPSKNLPEYICILRINDEPIIEAKIIDNQIFFNIKIYDKEKKLILEIRENIIVQSVEIWDIKFKSNTLTINSKAYDILAEIKFNPPNEINIVKGKFHYDRGVLVLDPKKMKVVGFEVSGDSPLYFVGTNCICIGTTSKNNTCMVDLIFE